MVAPPLEVMNKLIKKIAIVLELKYEVFNVMFQQFFNYNIVRFEIF